MILILTTEEGDAPHYRFIDWLEYYNADYCILSGEGIYSGKHSVIINANNELIVDDINFSKKNRVLFNRRFLTISKFKKINQDYQLNKSLNKIIQDALYISSN